MTKRSENWLRLLLAVGLLAGTDLFLIAHGGDEQLPRREEFASFPRNLGTWVGRDLAITAGVREVLGDGDFLDKLFFRRPDEPSVDLFLAYFPTQRTGSTMHSPQNCLPGSGWIPIEHTHISLPGPDGKAMAINRYVIARGPERQMVLYWYQAHGRVIASEYWAKFFLVADSVRLNRSDGALVRIVTSISQNESADAAQQRAVEFTALLTPLLATYIPR